ncbi:MAG: hypothetical protein IJU57_05955 [Clostridia bacterium]|nr:hypothetical protein [Clostridia bacterium]
MKTRIAAVGIAHPFEVGYDQAGSLLSTTVRTLLEQGVECFDTGIVMEDLDTVKKAAEALKTADFDALLLCIATWSEDHHLLDLLSYVDKPIILRAYPAFDTGSLCMAHQVGAVFTDIGKSYDFIYGEPDDRECALKAKALAAPYSLAEAMSHVRLGTIGGRVKGMTEIAYDEFAIKEKTGARIVNIDEKEMLEKVSGMSDEEAEKLFIEKKKLIPPCSISSTSEGLRESVKFYGALKSLCQEYDLQALAVKCYTTFMGKVCLGYSLLAEEGIMGSCEGDVTSGIAMTMLYELSGRPVNNTDLLYLDNEKNTILFSHCGSSGFSIAGGEIELAPVRLAETGVCCKFVMAPGKVTALNLCGHGEKFRMAVMTGEAVPCGMEFPGNPVVVRFDADVEDINQWIIRNGIGHHWMICYGDFRQELKRFAEIKGIVYNEI